MTFEWQPAISSRIVAEGYDAEAETIYVEFPKGGVQWWYSNCPLEVWEQFTAVGQSRGEFIHQVLDAKPNGRFA
jgi:hypothetical protein